MQFNTSLQYAIATATWAVDFRTTLARLRTSYPLLKLSIENTWGVPFASLMFASQDPNGPVFPYRQFAFNQPQISSSAIEGKHISKSLNRTKYSMFDLPSRGRCGCSPIAEKATSSLFPTHRQRVLGIAFPKVLTISLTTAKESTLPRRASLNVAIGKSNLPAP